MLRCRRPKRSVVKAMTAEEMATDAEAYDPLALHATHIHAAAAAHAHVEVEVREEVKHDAAYWWGRWDGEAHTPHEAYRTHQQHPHHHRPAHDASKSSTAHAHERCAFTLCPQGHRMWLWCRRATPGVGASDGSLPGSASWFPGTVPLTTAERRAGRKLPPEAGRMAWEKRRLGKQLEGMKRTASIRSQYLGVEEVPVVSVWTVPTRRGLRHEVFKTEASTEEEERFLRCVLCYSVLAVCGGSLTVRAGVELAAADFDPAAAGWRGWRRSGATTTRATSSQSWSSQTAPSSS